MTDLVAKIGADVTEFNRKMKEVGDKMEAVGDRMKSIGKSMSVALTAPLTLIAGLAVKSFAEQAKATAQLEALLRSSGQEVKNNLKDFQDFASEMQRISTVGDESTLELLKLATSLGLGAEQAKRAATNAIALSRAMGIDEQSAIRMTSALEQGSTTMIGKYLPSIRGIEDESKKATEAQRLLANMFGTVTAEAGAGLGPMIQMKNAIDDLMEQIGEIIVEAITPFIKWIKEIAEKMQGWDKSTKIIVIAIGALVASIGPLLVGLGALISIAPGVATAWALITGPIGLLIASIGAAAAIALFLKDVNIELTKSAKQVMTASEKEADAVKTLEQSYGRALTAEEKYWIGQGVLTEAQKKTIEKQKEYVANIAILEQALGRVLTRTEKLRLRTDGLTESQKLSIEHFKKTGEVLRTQEIDLIKAGEAARLAADHYEEFLKAQEGLMKPIKPAKPTQELITTPTFEPPPIIDWTKEVQLRFQEMATKIAGIVSGIADKIGQIWSGIGAIFDQSMKNQIIALENRYGKEREEIQATLDALTVDEENRVAFFDSEQERIEAAKMNDEEKAAALERLKEREKAAAETAAKAKEAAQKKAADLEAKLAEEKKKLARKGAIMDKASALVSAAVNTAVAITKAIAASPLTGGLPFSAIVGVLGAAQIALIAAQPIPMAKGGIVTSPTLAMIGEAGPEAVMPLRNMPSMQGEQELVARVRGEDLEFVLQRVSRNKRFLQ